jgi:hypothetical protein
MNQMSSETQGLLQQANQHATEGYQSTAPALNKPPG